MEAILQIVGALSVLAAYVAGQLRLLHQEHPAYLMLNTVGAASLAALALHEQQWGFLLLEGVWTLVSLRGMIRWSIVYRRGTCSDRRVPPAGCGPRP